MLSPTLGLTVTSTQTVSPSCALVSVVKINPKAFRLFINPKSAMLYVYVLPITIGVNAPNAIPKEAKVLKRFYLLNGKEVLTAYTL